MVNGNNGYISDLGKLVLYQDRAVTFTLSSLIEKARLYLS